MVYTIVLMTCSPDVFDNSPYPTAIQTTIDAACTVARFDFSGRFIAAGRNDGLVVVYDLDTKSPVRWLEGHVKGITSIECVGLSSAACREFSFVPAGRRTRVSS